MKGLFSGYYQPTKEEFNQLWADCLFVLDANVLLNLYRYSPKTSKVLLGVIRRISSRLWIPHQAALEYQVNRLTVIAQQKKAYSEITSALEKARNQIESKLNEYRRHPYIDTDSILKQLDTTLEKISGKLKLSETEHPNLVHQDQIRDELTQLLDGKVGSPYDTEKLKAILKEGEERYRHSIPPGYSDASTKEGERKFGDLIVWFQVVDKAKEVRLPIILVTDDVKEDWWWKFSGQTIGPRPELVEEMSTKASVACYFYQSDQFMTYAEQFLKQDVEKNAIDEVRALRKEDEMRQELAILTAELQLHEAQRREVEFLVAASQADLQQLVTEREKLNANTDHGDNDEIRSRRVSELTDLIQIHKQELQMHQMQLAQLTDRLKFTLDRRASVAYRASEFLNQGKGKPKHIKGR